MNVPNTIEMPKINGLTVRAFDIEKDLSAVVKLANIVSDFEESDEYLSEESLRNYYSHVVNCDFATDFMLVEVEGQLVGFQRISWREMDLENTISYRMVGNVHPDWMNKGIATFMMDWAEDRLSSIAEGHSKKKIKEFRSFAIDKVKARKDLLTDRGFTPNRYFFSMERKNLDEIPEVKLPEGIIVRPPKNEADWRKAWDCLDDAFKDHWGYAAGTESEFQSLINEPDLLWDLTQLAWDGDTVVGTVLIYISEETNKKKNMKRGWTEDISVRRDYRGKGIAKALIYGGMNALKSVGMETAALGVDTDNPTGALGLYKHCGYETNYTEIVYSKKL